MTSSGDNLRSSGSKSPGRSGAPPPTALDHGMQVRLTLVLRPAGIDELPFLESWIRTGLWPTAVLPLTPAQNEPHSFLTSLTRSLAGILGKPVDAAAHAELTLEDTVTELLNAASGAPDDFAWVFKDYDCITEATVHHAVSWMLDYAPSQMHLYLTLDREPPLPNLPRLRVRRHLLAIPLRLDQA